MTRKKPDRKKTPSETEDFVLVSSARRCALCFYLSSDTEEKAGQIAHLDQNPSNTAEDNLIWMCLEHHSLYDSKNRQHKNYKISEVKTYRKILYKWVSNGKPPIPQNTQSNESDKKILQDFLGIVPSSGSIDFVRNFNFAGWSFDMNRLDDIHRFWTDRRAPEHEFLDPELEDYRKIFWERCASLLNLIAIKTFPTSTEGWNSIPEEWEENSPERFKRAVDEIHTASEALCNTYDEFVRFARKKLRV